MVGVMLETTKKILEFLEGWFEERPYSPSIGDIEKALGHSKSTIHAHLEVMEEMALISWARDENGRHIDRTIVLPLKGDGETPGSGNPTDNKGATP